MEKKNPDFVDVELANKTITGFITDSTNKIFIGRKRQEYTTFIYPFYELYVEHKIKNDVLFKKALKKRTRRMKQVSSVLNGVNFENSIIITKDEMDSNEIFVEEDNQIIKLFNLSLYVEDILSVINIISSDGKTMSYSGSYVKVKKNEAAHVDIVFIGDNGFAIIMNRLIKKK